MGGDDVLNILGGLLYVAVAAADVAADVAAENRRIDRRIAKRERKLERQRQRANPYESRVESRINPSMNFKNPHIKERSRRPYEARVESRMNSSKRSPRAVRMPVSKANAATKPAISRKHFDEEDLKPNQQKVPLGKCYDVRFCDIDKLRGPLVHDTSKEWRYQPEFIIHSGFMQKTGEYNSAYKRRFFILTSRQQLYYYKLNHDSDVVRIASKDFIKKQAKQFERGVIRLQNFKSIDVRSNENEFRLRSKNSTGRDFLFKCDQAIDMKKWILIIRATAAAIKDPWKLVDGEHPPDAPIKSKNKADPQITPNFFSHIPDPKKADEDDCPLDDIDPIMPELVDPTDYQGPGYSPVVVEPSAPEIFEGNLDDEIQIAPSAPPPAYEDTVCPGAANHSQIEGIQTGK